MASAKAIYYNDNKTKKLLNVDGEKRPISFQIFGSDEISLAYSAKYLSEFADIIDVNMGCPAPKVVKNGDGSKLLLDLEKAKKVMEAVVKNSKVPVTLKIRKGWDKEHIVACEIAKIAEKTGISAITVHGRTRTEYYGGMADLEIIKKVKESVKIPVIGNGDIIDEETALRMFKETNVDGIMIGRAAFGNPWIFKRIIHYLQTGEKLENITNQEKLEVIKEHIKLATKENKQAVVFELRKHIAWYTKNLKNSSEFRNSINKIENEEELIEKINEYFKTL